MNLQSNNISMSPVATPSQPSTMLAAEQARAVAEVQASLVVARANPRNEVECQNNILNACKRKSLAEQALYAYPRGGQLVTGPSIRLAEVLARHWRNLHYGFREVGRGKDYSEVEAFCHDLETNVRVTRQFQVRHLRDTKQGSKKLGSERDKYELIASMAQRRVRACILEIIPGDIVDSAVEACEATLKQNLKNITKQIENIKKSFQAIGVTVEMLEAYLQRPLKSIVPVDVVNLRKIHRSIMDGIGTVEDFFNLKTQANKGETIAPNAEKEGESSEEQKTKNGELPHLQTPNAGPGF